MDIIIAHGPVVEIEEEKYIDHSLIRFKLEDGRCFNIKFFAKNDGVVRYVTEPGCFDQLDFIYDIGDAIQWTVDNWCEIEELVDWSLDKKESI